MLSTSNVSAAQAETYYTQDDYYSRDQQQQASRWLDNGAATLGLSGTIEPEVFRQLLNGFTPDGQPLSGKPIHPKTRRSATDYTFSAPKSVSIAALIQQDERILQAHHHAVTRSLSVLEERYAQTRISTGAGRQRVQTGNLIAAVFTHATSREMEQFELAGYSPELLKLFSTRRQQIEQLIALWDAEGTSILDRDGNEILASAARREAANLRSRKQKPKEIDSERLLRGWNALVQLKGLELPAIPEVGRQANFQNRTETIVESAIQHCSEREAVFRQTQIERFILEHHLGEQSFGELQQAISLREGCANAHCPELIQVEDGKYTTQAALHLELQTIRLMQTGKGQVSAITSPEQVNSELATKSLTLGQREAIQLASTTNDQLQDLFDCTREFAAAVRAIDCGIKHLEQAIASRTQFATAIARFDAALAEQPQRVEPSQQFNAAQLQQRSSELMQVETKENLQRHTHSIKQRYQRMWQQYSQGVQASNPVRLDYLVAQRAFEHGRNQREIARMLTAGSLYVRQLEQRQGKEKARVYVNQIGRMVCRKSIARHNRRKQIHQQSLCPNPDL
jgi:hypothetical protein